MIKSILTGLAASIAAGVLTLALLMVWVAVRVRNNEMGFVLAGSVPILLAMGVAFVAGFCWTWSRRTAAGKPLLPNSADFR